MFLHLLHAPRIISRDLKWLFLWFSLALCVSLESGSTKLLTLPSHLCIDLERYTPGKQSQNLKNKVLYCDTIEYPHLCSDLRMRRVWQ